MTQSQGETAPFFCPRCGGLMRKPTGSTLYWHADSNHPRCDITNIAATVLEVQTPQSPEKPPESPMKKRKK